MKRVLVGIPTINRPILVRETIASVLAQTYSDISVIVSDNRSDPVVIDAVQSYVEELDDARIRFAVQPSNGGEYGQARYFLECAAQFDYLMILHDDDILKPRYIEKAVEALDDRPEISAFLARPYVLDENGDFSETQTKKYLDSHGRRTATTGPVDVLSKYLMYGFLPISGTVFRRSALQRTGFVDQLLTGNYPFECDVFLRLGSTSASAWYQDEELIGFRFHCSSMRNYMNLMQNRQVVNRMLDLFSGYRFYGRVERRRRAIVSRLHRANAIMDIREGRRADARKSVISALKANWLSLKAWAIAPVAVLLPRLGSLFLRRPSESYDSPAYTAPRERQS